MTALNRRRFLQGLGGSLAAAAAPGLAACSNRRPSSPTSSERTHKQQGVRRFPADFAWGAATSAYQVEGAAKEDGRGPSVWDVFDGVHNGDTGDVAADHYHRYVEDLDLMKRLGLKSYRFSISWSRLLPEGKGKVNQKGLDFYRRLVDGLNDRGITPVATLWHWDTPLALQETGGWESRDTALRFGDYAAIVYDALGADVQTYLTLNEPKTVLNVGYRYGSHAPGKQDERAASIATHHMLLGHGLAVEALRAAAVESQIGPALNLHPTYPEGDSEEAKDAAVLQDGVENRLYLDPIFDGSYPAEVLAEAIDGDALQSVIKDGDLDIISSPIDLLAINYYTPVVVTATRDQITKYPLAMPADWLQIYPQGLYDLLTRLADDYGRELPLMITECGRPTETERSGNGTYADDDRIEFLRDHFVQAHKAIEAGANLVGFQVWSLLDNFEWAEGYDQRWGIVHVDFETQKRTPKKSAEWYAGVIRNNAV